MDELQLRAYLERRFGAPVRVISVSRLGDAPADRALKGHGYGVPLRLDFEVAGAPHTAVFETLSPGPFGHEHMADRAQVLLWSHRTFDHLPRHVRSLDVGGIRADGSLVSLGSVEELFALREFVAGREYVRDLERLRDGGGLRPLDLARCDALCDYLVGIHRVRGADPGLYVRRVRELVGHGECILGMLDSYPPAHPEVAPGVLEGIERSCVAWRWRLKARTDRLRQVHGDFHPWNVLFREGTDFTALDRARGEWGEPADDVVCLTMNYLFFSLLRGGRLEGEFEQLFLRFWDRYLAASGDEDLPEVAAPFLAFRGLVMASPRWYPVLPDGVRGRLLDFVRGVLDGGRFDPRRVNDYGGGVGMGPGFAVWVTGLPASGKSTVARALARALAAAGVNVEVLESDVWRPVLTPRANYAEDERDAFYAALVHVASRLVRHGVAVIFDATGNRRAHRDRARRAIGRYAEIYVECPLEVCRARDPKGLYRRARSGEATTVPGVQSPYEPPEQPDVVVRGDHEDPDVAAARIVATLSARGFLAGADERHAPRRG